MTGRLVGSVLAKSGAVGTDWKECAGALGTVSLLLLGLHLNFKMAHVITPLGTLHRIIDYPAEVVR